MIEIILLCKMGENGKCGLKNADYAYALIPKKNPGLSGKFADQIGIKSSFLRLFWHFLQKQESRRLQEPGGC